MTYTQEQRNEAARRAVELTRQVLLTMAENCKTERPNTFINQLSHPDIIAATIMTANFELSLMLTPDSTNYTVNLADDKRSMTMSSAQ